MEAGSCTADYVRNVQQPLNGAFTDHSSRARPRDRRNGAPLWVSFNPEASFWSGQADQAEARILR